MVIMNQNIRVSSSSTWLPFKQLSPFTAIIAARHVNRKQPTIINGNATCRLNPMPSSTQLQSSRNATKLCSLLLIPCTGTQYPPQALESNVRQHEKLDRWVRGACLCKFHGGIHFCTTANHPSNCLLQHPGITHNLSWHLHWPKMFRNNRWSKEPHLQAENVEWAQGRSPF